MSIEYVIPLRKFRDTDSGRFISQKAVLALSGNLTGAGQLVAIDLAGQLDRGEISVARWQKAMQDELKYTYIQQYMLARGGRDQMTSADWGRIGRALRDQYDYLKAFADEIKAGTLSEAKIRQRAEMYFSSSRFAFERGRAGAWDIELPYYPTQGSECLVNCECHWDIKQKGERVEATWVLGSTEHCPTCTDRAAEANPLVYVNGELQDT